MSYRSNDEWSVNMQGCREWLMVVLFSVVFFGSLDAADTDAPQSWPNWMGPNWDGISNEAGWSSVWPDEGLKVKWSRSIGIGFSSISIVDGRLFTMGHDSGEEIVWCLNAATGDEIWSRRYPSELNDNLHEGGPAATPTIHVGRVYTLGKEGQLHCFEFESGKPLWNVMLQEDLGLRTPEWGFASSPRIVGNQLLLEAGRVVSYDAQTGNKNWQTKMHLAGYGSAAVFQHGQNEFVATLDCEGLRICMLDNGAEVAFRQWPSPFQTNSTTPIIHDNKIFISTAYNVGCGLFDFDGRKLKEIYKSTQMRNHFNNSVLFNGYLYGFDGNSNLGRVVQVTCMKFDTGKVAWKKAGMGCGSLMIADGKLLILSEQGDLVLAKATHEGFEELARSQFLKGRCWTAPVLFQGYIYGRNAAGNLVCVELPK